MVSLFFFQAEDGIRDYKVTGVQTCALPISAHGVGRSGPAGTMEQPDVDAAAASRRGKACRARHAFRGGSRGARGGKPAQLRSGPESRRSGHVQRVLERFRQGADANLPDYRSAGRKNSSADTGGAEE